MAVNDQNEHTFVLPSDCRRQPSEASGVSDDGKASFAYVAKGPYASLETKVKTLSQGDLVETGWVARSWNLQRGNGGTGTLTINCVPPTSSTESTAETPAQQIPLSDVWSIHAVRNDMSVYAYCGPSTSNPKRIPIELWQKESDGNLAGLYKYREADGTVKELDGNDKALAAKIEKGVESVVRFYPVITRKRTYSVMPDDCMENVGVVSSPNLTAIPGSSPKKPSTLSQKLKFYEWLKMQDDIDEQSDGSFSRTESWWGLPILKTGAHPWDPDLYGEKRWDTPAMPQQTAGEGK